MFQPENWSKLKKSRNYLSFFFSAAGFSSSFSSEPSSTSILASSSFSFFSLLFAAALCSSSFSLVFLGRPRPRPPVRGSRFSFFGGVGAGAEVMFRAELRVRLLPSTSPRLEFKPCNKLARMSKVCISLFLPQVLCSRLCQLSRRFHTLVTHLLYFVYSTTFRK